MIVSQSSEQSKVEPGREYIALQLNKDISVCRLCSGLNQPDLTESAPGYGSIDSRIFVVGQSLCGPCMKTKIPFTGGSGKLLDRAFETAGVLKEEVFTTNVVHCHPADNRPSKPEEVSNCRQFLQRELDLVRPSDVIMLGRDAIQWFLGPQERLEPLLGRVFGYGDMRLHPFLHPSYIMRQGQVLKQAYIDDLAKVIRCVSDNPKANKEQSTHDLVKPLF